MTCKAFFYGRAKCVETANKESNCGRNRYVCFGSSALRPKADMLIVGIDVCYVPIADIVMGFARLVVAMFSYSG